MAVPRTYLFVPGNRPERFAKALASGADAVVLDLEDAVAADAKADARAAVGAWAATADPSDRARAVVRINDTASPEHVADLQLVAEAGVQAVMLPKAETVEQVAAVGAAGPLRVLALIESAIGVEQARGRRAEHGRVELTGADDGRVLVALVDVHDHVLAEHLPGKVAIGVHQHDEAEDYRQQAGKAAERDLQELPPADHIAPQNWK